MDAFAYQMTAASTNSGYLGDADVVCQDAEVLRRLASSRLARLFTRFAAATAVSTACSQLAFVLVFGVGAVSRFRMDTARQHWD